MKIPNAAPGEGARNEYDFFNNWQVGAGEKHSAYFAGGAQWFVAHPSDRGSKPCLLWMTENAVGCRFCAVNKVPQQIGYVPVWRETDYRPLFVIVYAEEREWIEKLELHDRVLIGRERDRGARVWVRKCLNQEPKFTTTLLRRTIAQDITTSLLRLWKLPELDRWLCSGSDNAVSLTPKVSAADVKTEPETRPLDVNRLAEHFDAGAAEAEERAATQRRNAEWARQHGTGNGNGNGNGKRGRK